MLRIHVIKTGAFETNTWILSDDAGRAVAADPGDEAERILGFLASRKLSLTACLLTHGHVDHINALADVLDAASVPAFMHESDLAWAFGHENCFPPFYGPARKPGVKISSLRGGERLLDGPFECRVIHSPGHSPGSVCFLFEAAGALLSGDTLFAGGAGRTDLPGGDERLLAESLALLKTLDGTIRVFPGHGPATTIAAEKRSNPFFA